MMHYHGNDSDVSQTFTVNSKYNCAPECSSYNYIYYIYTSISGLLGVWGNSSQWLLMCSTLALSTA